MDQEEGGADAAGGVSCWCLLFVVAVSGHSLVLRMGSNTRALSGVLCIFLYWDEESSHPSSC